MQKILLSNILPNIFSDRPTLQSEVWRKDIEFLKGENYLIKAESGKGKSSLLSYIYGIRYDFENDIFFDKTNTKDISTKQWDTIRNHSLSFVFQELRLFDQLTVLENILLKNQHTNHLSLDKISIILRRLEVFDKSEVRCDKLSWGQKQRVAIVRALCQPIDFMLLDEPISHLDDSTAEIVGNLLGEIAKEEGFGVIVSSIGKDLPMKYDHIFNL